jgi:hypothetical protein
MSYFQIDTSTTPPPGSTESLQGNSGGPVGPNGSNLINVIGDVNSGINIAGNPGTNTLTVSYSPPITGSVSTTGAETKALLTYAMTGAATYKFSMNIAGFSAASSVSIGVNLNATLRTNGATATVIETPDADTDKDALLASTIHWEVTAVANSLVVNVIGQAGVNINWVGEATFLRVT